MIDDITIEVSNGTESIAFHGSKHESILSSALRQGVALRYHCASGICASCRASLATGSAISDDTGTVVRDINGDGDAKDVLLCKTRPQTDCKIVLSYSLDELSSEFIEPDYCHGTVVSVQHLGGNLYDLSVELSANRPFHPGQYALVSIDGDTTRRAYSMASYRPGASAHRYIIALNEQGRVSKALCAADIIGQKLSVFGPLGHCYPKMDEFQDIVLIVGGSGVSVALAMMEWYLSHSLDKKDVSIRLFWGVRELHDSTLLTSLDEAASRLGDSSITVCYDACQDVSAQENKKYLRFFEGNPADAATSYDTPIIGDDTGVFISGSSGFVEHVTRTLMLETSVEVSHIRSDSFA